MALKLMFITNDEDVAKIAEKSGVDWIFLDLEIEGKIERQGGYDTVISKHTIDDINRIKRILTKSELLVRINPINENSKEEIDSVIENGADIVMLPFFKTKEEVALFIDYVGSRAKTCLLCETVEAVHHIDEILDTKGIDMVHIGLNDLHLGYRLNFMFELLTNGIVEMLCDKFKARGIPYGFGGIAQIGHGDLPAEYVLAEHYRLGSSMAILSRSFCNVTHIHEIGKIREIFNSGVKALRDYESMLEAQDQAFFEKNHEKVCKIVKKISQKKRQSE